MRFVLGGENAQRPGCGAEGLSGKLVLAQTPFWFKLSARLPAGSTAPALAPRAPLAGTFVCLHLPPLPRQNGTNHHPIDLVEYRSEPASGYQSVQLLK